MKSVFRCTAVFFTIFLVLANGQAPRISDDMRKAILDYSLNLTRADQLITAMEAMTAYVISRPDAQERLRKYATMTLAEQEAQVEKDPMAMGIIKKNNLTAKEYIVGVPALRMALTAAAMGKADNVNIIASPANRNFAKANLSVLKPKMDAADRAGLRR